MTAELTCSSISSQFFYFESVIHPDERQKRQCLSSARRANLPGSLRVSVRCELNFTMFSRTEYLNHHRPNWVAHVRSLNMFFESSEMGLTEEAAAPATGQQPENRRQQHAQPDI